MKSYFHGIGFEDHYCEDDDPPRYDSATVYLARVLAETAGMSWDVLATHTSFRRTHWYELARRTLEKIEIWRVRETALQRQQG